MSDVSGGKIRVLIVDDNYHVNIDVLSTHLRSLGSYEPKNALTLDEFKAKVEDADAILLDVSFVNNHWGGLVALQELRESDSLSPSSRRCLERVIIRSDRTETAALKAGIPVPPYFMWLPSRVSLAGLTRALTSLAERIARDG